MSRDKTSSGERTRIRHALDRLEACVAAMRLALQDERTPIGHEAAQAMTQTAVEIAVHAASADTALLLQKKRRRSSTLTLTLKDVQLLEPLAKLGGSVCLDVPYDDEEELDA